MRATLQDHAKPLACAALTRPGGTLFFSTINRNPKSWLFAIVGAEYALQMLPKGTHNYRKFIKPSEIAAQLRTCGMQIKDISGMSYNPLSKRYSLGRDIDVNYLMTACFDD